MINIESEIQALLKEIGPGRMSSTAYDTAWVARLKDISQDLSYHALDWLCENQHNDGSWGAEFPFYYHDRIVCTLSAMIALTYRGRRQRDKTQIQNGQEALERITSGATQGLQSGPNGATVGFELITPTLVAEAERLGIIKPQGRERILSRLAELRAAKMKNLRGLNISRHITIAHSAEMAGEDHLEVLDTENLQERNGSVACSPSATAYFAIYVKPGDSQALNYLFPIINSHNGGAPTLAPIEIFERIWALWNISHTNLYHENKEIASLCNTHLDYLEKNWKRGYGLGFSKNFSLPDADDTSVAFEILSKFGRNPEPDAILQYEEAEWFRCFHHEANPSTDVNIHVLGALKWAGFDNSHPSIQKSLRFIRSTRISNKYWLDKWHLSAYYTTSHLIISAKGYDDQLCEESIKWILDTQQPDGSWGFFNRSTAEETAYCIQALAIWQKHTGKSLSSPIKQAGFWLSGNHRPPYPPLWIDKSLYCPETLVKSCILSALTLATESS
jgi:halimadienyl-diphosphate synthase